MPTPIKRMAYFSWVRQTLKYLFLFSNNKCKDEVHFASQRKKVDVAIYPFRIFIKSSKCKKVPRDLWKLLRITLHYASV